MPCNHPHKAFDTGLKTDNGKRLLIVCPGTSGDFLSVAAAAKRGFMVSPGAPLVDINGVAFLTDPIPLPCGKCVGCRMEAAKQWKIRVCHEAELYKHDQVFFVTLTYDNAHLPINQVGEPYLKKSDIDKFLDDLRLPSYGVRRRYKFYLCGEYGGEFHRPHWHLILMATWLDDLIPYEFQAYHSAMISKAWPHGIHQVKYVEENMIAYVCGYVEKKQCDPLWEDYPVKPFTMKSRNLGVHKCDSIKGTIDRKVYGKFGSHYAAIPRAYLRKLESEPWMPDYRARSIELAQLAAASNAVVYGSTDEEMRGFIADEHQLKSLQEKRHLIL